MDYPSGKGLQTQKVNWAIYAASRRKWSSPPDDYAALCPLLRRQVLIQGNRDRKRVCGAGDSPDVLHRQPHFVRISHPPCRRQSIAAAITESLPEAELFGYEEGALTGSRRGGRKGLFEIATRGTLLSG